MKKLLTILVAIVATITTSAQAEKSIIIEQKSFRPVHSDALTGVNIDPIGLDSSKRPCARLKVRINRMTKENINELQVKIITNNQLTKCKTAEYDNGLIIEMTAKPQTRFYLQHDLLGYSNEVCLDLEANKEYRLDAYLNQQYPVTIMTDVEGADVYIDDMFKGRTTSSLRLVTHDVAPGKHILRVEYSGKSNEQIVNISSDNLVFVQNLLSQQTTPAQQPTPVMAPTNKSYKIGDYYNDGKKEGVVFEVTPDGKHGKIVSMKQSENLCWSSDKEGRKTLIGTNDENDGAYNMQIVKCITDWQTKYPAFAYCASLGEDWYLPAIKELEKFTKNTIIHDTVNKTLVEKGGLRLYSKREDGDYWSSTECGKWVAWIVNVRYSGTLNHSKHYKYSVRAVSAF
ncbi:MAG: DUF1566 domain-containing protein [Alistipes sp.]|nr:DUF1566 domain-containing protein [Alistipes sp.]